MFQIQTLNKISHFGLKEFPDELYTVNENILNPDAILLRSHSLISASIPSSVKAIGRAGAGVNNIPLDTCNLKGITVFNTPGANANAVTELVLAGMLLASRHIYSALEYVKELQNSSNDIEKEIEANKKKFAGFELLGKTLGIIGLGSVGVRVANAAVSLGMNVIGYDPTINVSRAWELSSKVKQAKSLENLLHQSDFISLHVPLLPDTKAMMNTERLHQIKNGAILLNFSRDEIVSRKDILAALNAKKISHYVSDFPNLELKNHPQVISLPHLGASTKEAEDNCALMIVRQIRDFLEIGAITNSVNLPNIDINHLTTASRLAIINENIPSMVAQISTILATHNLNIINLLNKSRNNMAYTLLDLDQILKNNILKELGNIHGVKSVRQIVNSK